MASSRCLIDFSYSVHPAKSQVSLRLQLQPDNWYLDTNHIDVFRFEVEGVPPVPLSHFDPKITVHIEPLTIEVKPRFVTPDFDWQRFRSGFGISPNLSLDKS